MWGGGGQGEAQPGVTHSKCLTEGAAFAKPALTGPLLYAGSPFIITPHIGPATEGPLARFQRRKSRLR